MSLKLVGHMQLVNVYSSVGHVCLQANRSTCYWLVSSIRLQLILHTNLTSNKDGLQ